MCCCYCWGVKEEDREPEQLPLSKILPLIQVWKNCDTSFLFSCSVRVLSGNSSVYILVDRFGAGIRRLQFASDDRPGGTLGLPTESFPYWERLLRQPFWTFLSNGASVFEDSGDRQGKYIGTNWNNGLCQRCCCRLGVKQGVTVLFNGEYASLWPQQGASSLCG